jgi:hypothetical protein
MVQMWVGLGNQTPKVIKLVENRLWKAIITVATTCRPLEDIVKDGLRDIHDIISNFPDESELEPHWFRAGQFRFKASVLAADSDWFICIGQNQWNADTSLWREEEEESESEADLDKEVELYEEKYDVDLESFAILRSSTAPEAPSTVKPLMSITPLLQPSLPPAYIYNSPPLLRHPLMSTVLSNSQVNRVHQYHHFLLSILASLCQN